MLVGCPGTGGGDGGGVVGVEGGGIVGGGVDGVPGVGSGIGDGDGRLWADNVSTDPVRTTTAKTAPIIRPKNIELLAFGGIDQVGTGA